MRLSSLIFVVGLVVAAAPQAVAAETDAAAARQLTATLVEDAHSAMTSAEPDRTQRATGLKSAISRAFALDIWERFLVGDRGLSPAQLDDFRSLLPGFLAQLYAEQFGKGLERRPEIHGTREVRRDVMVSAEIPRSKGKPLPVEYRVREFPERGPLVIDVMVGGISFLVLKRDEFAALLEQGGPGRLLAYMRENSM